MNNDNLRNEIEDLLTDEILGSVDIVELVDKLLALIHEREKEVLDKVQKNIIDLPKKPFFWGVPINPEASRLEQVGYMQAIKYLESSFIELKKEMGCE